MEKHTVAICFVHQAISGLRARSIAPEPVLRAAGIAPDLLEMEQARVSASSYSALWMGVAAILDDEFFGQDTRSMRRGSFAMLCHAVMGSKTLGQGMERVARYFGLLLDDIDVRLEGDGERAALVVGGAIAQRTNPSIFAQETMLIMLLGLMNWLVRRRVPVLLTTFSYGEPAYSAEYRLMYSRQLAFDRPATALVFDASWLDHAVRQDERSIKAFLRDAPYNVVVKYSARSSVVARIRRHLRVQHPEQWPVFDALARALHMSASSLRRRLIEEAASFQEIKDDLRRDLAIEALSHSTLSVAEISTELGFAEPGAFHRAFRRWTGSPPGAYRGMHTLGSKDEDTCP